MGMAPISCAISFLVVRRIGGQALAEVQWSLIQRIMSRLDEHPIATVALLRLCFFLAPVINYILALSSVSFKDFIVGTIVGLVLPLTIAVFFIEQLIQWMGWSHAQVHPHHAINSPGVFDLFSPPPA